MGGVGSLCATARLLIARAAVGQDSESARACTGFDRCSSHYISLQYTYDGSTSILFAHGRGCSRLLTVV